VAFGLFGPLVTPLALEAPTGRCVTGFVLPLAQAAGFLETQWSVCFNEPEVKENVRQMMDSMFKGVNHGQA
jgi:hypothetical protein